MTEKHDTALECRHIILTLAMLMDYPPLQGLHLGPKVCQQIRELAGKIREGEKP